MKWIGQHIWSFISRFRNDVYLESVAESAQDHVVGIDADGKLYKQDVSVGDITGVSITTDSGGGSAAAAGSGNAAFDLLGATGVGVTNSGTTITATAVPGEIDHDSLSNFVAAEHYRWDTDIASTATVHTNNITDLHGAGVDGAANQLLTDDGDGTITSEANLTWDGDDLSATSGSTAKPSLKLIATQNGNKPASLNFKKDKGAAGVNGDYTGSIEFTADNSAQQQTLYNQILGEVVEATDTDEAGKFYFRVAASDGSASNLRDGLLLTGHSSNDIVNTEIGYGLTSETNVKGVLSVLGGNAIIKGTSAVPGSISFGEDTTNGTNIVNLKAADAMASNRIIGLPDASGTVALTADVPQHPTGAGENTGFKTIRVTLTESDCNSLHTTPVTLVAAQGLGTIIIPVSIFLKVDRDSSTAQSSSTADLCISWDGTTTLGSLLGYIRRFMWNESGDRLLMALIPGYGNEVGQSLTAGDNKPLKVATDAAITSGSIDSMEIWVTYYVIG